MHIKRQKTRSDLGFTLLELLLSLTIVAIIVVIIFGAMRIGVRAWEKGEADIEINQRQRIVLDLLKRQLASISLRKIADGGKNPFFLKGENKSMAFVSRVSMVPGNTFGLVLVKYIVESAEKNASEQLDFFEQNIVLLEEDADLDNLDKDAFYTLIPNAEEIAFEYLKAQSEEEGLTWQQTWDSEIDTGFPKAVKIIVKKDVNSPPVTAIARIVAEVDP